MMIWYSTYQLYPKGTLNSKTKTQFRQGALLRIRFEDGRVGFADLCPFSEMGDHPLDFELQQLKYSKPTQLGERSLHFAQKDAQARAEKKTLYRSDVLIKNHFLISDLARFDLSRLSRIEASGYTEFKVKMGRDLAAESEILENMVGKLSYNARLRLDFNCSLNRERFEMWFEKAQRWLRPALEFIEDPFAYDPETWRQVSRRWGVTFALDQAENVLKVGAEGAQIIVIKPAIQNVEKIIEMFKASGKKFVFTHYMDFPVGQMFAFAEAQSVKAQLGEMMLTCGLQHHDIYEGFTFQDAIRYDGPQILPPEGWGIGFDTLLENLSWVELK